MPGSGTWNFTDVDSYEASLGGLLNTLAVGALQCRIRLTRVELPKVEILRAQESIARVAFVNLPAERILISFSTRRDTRLIYDGCDVPYRSIVLHGVGERFHQRITGPAGWGYVSLPPGALARHTRLLNGRALSFADAGQILRPLHSDWVQLIRLHAEAGRIAETRLAHTAHPEVIRALEQDLIWTMVNCVFTARRGNALSPPKIAVLFEDFLATQPGRSGTVPDICRAIGVSEQKLRACCAKTLGMSPGRYQRLRRLKATRLAILRLGPSPAGVAEIMKHFSFAKFDHFVREYQAAYGERPF